MSGRVCYLGRADRGDRLSLVRLVGAASDQRWEQFASSDPVGMRREIAEAAAWMAERAARGDGPRGEIEVLCVDVEGGACGWVTSPSAESAVVAAAMASEAGAWLQDDRSGATVQALAAARAKPARRLLPRGGGGNGKAGPEPARKLAVLTVPDVPVRLLVDALDEQGVAVSRVVSLWQALAMAWDPAGPAASGDSVRGERVVATSSAVSAVVLIDPAGRLVWSWSQDGELIAGGSIRLAADRREHAEGERAEARGVLVGAPEVSRLTADWIAWSMQLGQAPVRVMCLGPATEDGEGLAPAELGEALGRAWPGATVDLVVHDDPIGATLARLARADLAPGGEGRTTLVDLTRRPGRAHRSMYRWAAAAVLAGSVALVGVGWRAWGAGQEASEEAAAARRKAMETVLASAPPRDQVQQATAEASPRTYFQKRIGDKRLAIHPTGGLEAAKPILPELETLSFVIANVPGVEIEEIQLQPSLAMMYVLVPDTRAYETLMQMLNEIGGSQLSWQPGRFSSEVNGKQRYVVEGAWKKPEAPAPGGGA